MCGICITFHNHIVSCELVQTPVRRCLAARVSPFRLHEITTTLTQTLVVHRVIQIQTQGIAFVEVVWRIVPRNRCAVMAGVVTLLPSKLESLTTVISFGPTLCVLALLCHIAASSRIAGEWFLANSSHIRARCSRRLGVPM